MIKDYFMQSRRSWVTPFLDQILIYLCYKANFKQMYRIKGCFYTYHSCFVPCPSKITPPSLLPCWSAFSLARLRLHSTQSNIVDGDMQKIGLQIANT